MRARASRTAALLIAAVLSTASACGSPERPPPILLVPDAQDLQPPAKPQVTAEVLTSEQAANAFDSSVEAWGDSMALQIGRLCRWFADNGATGLTCPTPPPDS